MSRDEDTIVTMTYGELRALILEISTQVAEGVVERLSVGTEVNVNIGDSSARVRVETTLRFDDGIISCSEDSSSDTFPEG